MTKQKLKSKSGANSRERLLEAAVDVFGKYGFEAATTRMIAKEAGVNIATIPYYFNGKDGLYHAAVTHIIEKIEGRAGSTFQQMATLSLNQNLSREEALDALENLLGTITSIMVGSSEGPRAARIILREQMDPSSTYDLIFARIMSPIINAISAFLTMMLGSIPPRTAKLRAVAIIGQIMAFRVARETVLRSIGLEGYTQEEAEEIRGVILEHTRGVIEALSRKKAI